MLRRSAEVLPAEEGKRLGKRVCLLPPCPSEAKNDTPLENSKHIALLERLFRQYQPMLVSFAWQYVKSAEDAREVVQEVFLSVWNNREHLREDGNLKAYLFTATRNKCLNWLEKKRLRIVSMDEDPGPERPKAQFPDSSPDGSEMLELAELRAVIFDEVQKLPAKCREIFILSRVEGLSHKEIGERLHISPKTVENQIGIALKRIRQRLHRFDGAFADGKIPFWLVFALFLPQILEGFGGSLPAQGIGG